MKEEWDDRIPVRIFRLAADGLGDKQIAESLGVDAETFARWARQKRAVKEALKEARRDKARGSKAIMEMMSGRMPRKARDLWDRMVRLEKAMQPRDKGSNARMTRRERFEEERALQDIVDKGGRVLKQHLFLAALVSSRFMVTEACRRIGISHAEYNAWTKDSEFKEVLSTLHQCKKDFLESALMDLVAERNPAAVVFANKTMNRDRGYGTKPEETTVHVKHEHSLRIDDLPIEARKAILEAMRAKKQPLLEDKSIVDAEVVDVRQTKTA